MLCSHYVADWSWFCGILCASATALLFGVSEHEGSFPDTEHYEAFEWLFSGFELMTGQREETNHASTRNPDRSLLRLTSYSAYNFLFQELQSADVCKPKQIRDLPFVVSTARLLDQSMQLIMATYDTYLQHLHTNHDGIVPFGSLGIARIEPRRCRQDWQVGSTTLSGDKIVPGT